MKPKRVYAVAAGEALFIKFGVANDGARRLEELRVSCPLPTTLIALTQPMPHGEAFALEWLVHRAAARFHVRGEWFKSCPKTLGFAELLSTKGPADLLAHFSCMANEQMAEAIRSHERSPSLSPSNFNFQRRARGRRLGRS